MTPFGRKLRELRAERGVTLKAMAEAIGVSPAYLSALEQGRRGTPTWYLGQRIIAYFNVIGDEAEDLERKGLRIFNGESELVLDRGRQANEILKRGRHGIHPPGQELVGASENSILFVHQSWDAERGCRHQRRERRVATKACHSHGLQTAQD